jgi:hypothetical protein
MQNTTMLALVFAAAVVVGGIALARRFRRGQAIEGAFSSSPRWMADPGASGDVPYSTAATEDIASACYKLAFGVARFDYQIFDDHARVLALVENALGEAAGRQEYFPRRPLLLPKLLQALNDTESTRQELVRLILEDPTLAGTTLKRANNAFYRMSAQPVESLDRAVVVLGSDGLRSLVSTAILQPLFRLPKGFFDRFPEIAWEQAQRNAAGAQAYAQATGSEDPFIAQLLGVLRALATLVLFRLTLDKYRTFAGLMPRPEVFIRALQQHRGRLAIEIGKTWELSGVSIAALEEQCSELSPVRMSALGRAVYYGELAGSIATAVHHLASSAEDGQAILLQQGLAPDVAAKLLQAARDADVSA